MNLTGDECKYCGHWAWPANPVHPTEEICLNNQVSELKGTLEMVKAVTYMRPEILVSFQVLIGMEIVFREVIIAEHERERKAAWDSVKSTRGARA
jgi:hypothetical protein